MSTIIMMAAVATIVIVGSAGTYLVVNQVESKPVINQTINLQEICDNQCIEDVACHIEGENIVCDDMNLDLKRKETEGKKNNRAI